MASIIYSDENALPSSNNDVLMNKTANSTRMKLRSSMSSSKDKGGRENNAKGGTKRSALGDVTNRHNSTSMGNTNGGANQQIKKGSNPVALKTRVLRKPSVTPGENGMESIKSPVNAKKPPASCISSNLKGMSLSKRKNLHDIDSMDKNDQLSAWQYAEDINTHFLEVEKSRMPSPTYMDCQMDINSKMRAILVDWLVDVHAKYQLLPQTLHITIDLIDRYLDVESKVKRQKLQLVGITAMFIASKYEEIYPPEVSEFVRITDNAYPIEQVFEMEAMMLKALLFRVTSPTAYQFLTRFLKASKTNSDETASFAHYITDSSLQEYGLVKFPPSAIAASAVMLARIQMNEFPVWNATLEYHTSYSKASLTPCIKELMGNIWKNQNGITTSSQLKAVKRKFSKDKFQNVAQMILKDFDLNDA